MSEAKSPLPMLAVFFLCALMTGFTENIINVALPEIIAYFGITELIAQWLVTGFMIVSAAMISITAFLVQRFPTRNLFIFASLIFLVASVGCFVSVSFSTLLLFRVMQSVATGMFVPLMFNAILAIAPREKLGTFMSLAVFAIIVGPALGPVFSGFMAGAFGWRGVFVIPFVAIALLFVAGLFLVHDLGLRRDVTFDAPSAVLVVLGISAVTFGLSQVFTQLLYGCAALLVGAVLLAVFAYRQLHLDAPLLDVRLLVKPAYLVAVVISLLIMLVNFSMTVLMPVYFQDALGMTASLSGLLILIPAACQAVPSLFSGRIYDKKGSWPLMSIGGLLLAGGLMAAVIEAQQLNALGISIAVAVSFIGIGFASAPNQTAGLASLTPEENPHGVAINDTVFQLGGAFGPSLFIGVKAAAAGSATAAGVTSAAELAVVGFVTATEVAAGIGFVVFIALTVFALRLRKRA